MEPAIVTIAGFLLVHRIDSFGYFQFLLATRYDKVVLDILDELNVHYYFSSGNMLYRSHYDLEAY
jgi:hypothetical protein